MILSQNQKMFSHFFSAFLEKNDVPWTLFVSEIMDYKMQDYLNAQKAAFQNTYGESTC